jgi:hypothetical protein
MKRTRTSREIKRTGDIRKDLSDAQLAAIGAAAIAYNEAEVLIDVLLNTTLGLRSAMIPDLTSRINGVDGKIELAKIALKDLGASNDARQLIAQSLGADGFGLMKQYRDAVIHARVLDAPAGLAQSPGKRGKTNEVLLTVDALNGLYERLVLLRRELIEACQIAVRLFIDQYVSETVRHLRQPAPHLAAIADLGQSHSEPKIQAAIARYREHQSRRLSLPPLPEFPDEPLTPPTMEELASSE